MGTMKSKNFTALLLHTAVYSGVMFFMMVPVLGLTTGDLAVFTLTCFVFHTIQDFATSKLTSSQFAKGKYNGLDGAFTIIGFDQFLHYCQIFLTYYCLTN